MNPEEADLKERWESLQRQMLEAELSHGPSKMEIFDLNLDHPAANALKLKEEENRAFMTKKRKLERELFRVTLNGQRHSLPRLRAQDMKASQFEMMRNEMSHLKVEIRQASLESFRWKKTLENFQERLKTFEMAKKNVLRQREKEAKTIQRLGSEAARLAADLRQFQERLRSAAMATKDLRFRGAARLAVLKYSISNLARLIEVNDDLEASLLCPDGSPHLVLRHEEISRSLEDLFESEDFLVAELHMKRAFHTDLFEYNMAQLEDIATKLAKLQPKQRRDCAVQTDKIMDDHEEAQFICQLIVSELGANIPALIKTQAQTPSDME